mmetsp:Transcript_6971/g.24247  ORF Transcript_6971/g.24247 Transcript_6971/m.24247 type:complete len:465 (-) Transcript_6971:80-1474(-)
MGCGASSAVSPAVDSQGSLSQKDGDDFTVPEEFSIALADVEVAEVLGAGAYGEVCAGRWAGEPVAIKKLKKFNGVEDADSAQEMLREAYLLSRCHHPNVLRLYGLCHAGVDSYWLVTELAEHGSLMDAVQENDPNIHSLDMVVQIAKDIARGMKYLHGQKPPILHRDLKPQNILLDGGYKARIADFGLSRMYREDVSAINPENLSMKGTPWYLAPEITRGYEHIDEPEKVDVFSFGVILWQIYHRQRVPDVPTLLPDGAVRQPVKRTNKMSVMQILKRREKGGYYIPIDKKCPKKLGRLMKACWDVEPSNRPTFAGALAELEVIIPNHKHKSRSGIHRKKVSRQTLLQAGQKTGGGDIPEDMRRAAAQVDASKPQQLGPLYEIDKLRTEGKQPSTHDVINSIKSKGSEAPGNASGVFGKKNKSTTSLESESPNSGASASGTPFNAPVASPSPLGNSGSAGSLNA